MGSGRGCLFPTVKLHFPQVVRVAARLLLYRRGDSWTFAFVFSLKDVGVALPFGVHTSVAKSPNEGEIQGREAWVPDRPPGTATAAAGCRCEGRETPHREAGIWGHFLSGEQRPTVPVP